MIDLGMRIGNTWQMRRSTTLVLVLSLGLTACGPGGLGRTKDLRPTATTVVDSGTDTTTAPGESTTTTTTNPVTPPGYTRYEVSDGSFTVAIPDRFFVVDLTAEDPLAARPDISSSARGQIEAMLTDRDEDVVLYAFDLDNAVEELVPVLWMGQDPDYAGVDVDGLITEIERDIPEEGFELVSVEPLELVAGPAAFFKGTMSEDGTLFAVAMGNIVVIDSTAYVLAYIAAPPAPAGAADRLVAILASVVPTP